MSTISKNPLEQALAEFRESSGTGKFFISLLLFVPVAFLAEFLAFPPLLTFILSALAVVPLAHIMSESTEALAHHAGPAIGGLLIATFGNAVELIIAVLALLSGLTEVVKASITGSIIGNILFVLGLSMFLGGLPREVQTFNRVGASASASQLTLAAIALIIPAVFASTIAGNVAEKARAELLENLSLVVGGILLICYISQLIFFLRTHSHLSRNEGEPAPPPKAKNQGFSNPLETRNKETNKRKDTEKVWGVPRAFITLLIATIVVGVVSEILVSSIEPVTKSLGWTELFVGVIFLAIIGNAAEYIAAITAARKNNMNLSINIALGSSLQLLFFVVPVLVFIGLVTGNLLNLRFEEFELAAIIVAILIVKSVATDGESNWFEGVQLIGAYLIIAVAFFLHP